MHRIDSDGATVDNLFTEGNAALSVPATVVSAAIMNDIQEEVIKPIEAVGLVLAKGTRDQLFNAILEIIKRGGRTSPIVFTVANNQAAAADVTGMPTIVTTDSIAMEFLFSIRRRTDSSNVVETGRAYVTWNPDTSAWEITTDSFHGDAGVVFSMLTTGVANTYKLQYVSDNLAGSSYAGTLRITDIRFIKVA